LERRAYPNESAAYRRARDELLEAEHALREQTERVAALRRTLPLGGEVKQDYTFEERRDGGGVRSVALSELFAPGRDSLLIYGFMFGPKMDRACPICTSFLDSLDGAAPHIAQRMNLTGNTRHIDPLWPLWNVLDLTPEGRGDSWYPALTYES
jgi:predicted dithiol-disulfide oxidoreductase (DUF899 family)